MRKYTIVFAALAAFLTVILGASVYVTLGTSSAQKNTLHINDGLQRQLVVDRILSAVKDAEAGQRGYVITGQEEYLVPFVEALALTDSLLQSFPTTENNKIIALQTILQQLVTARVSRMQNVVDVRRKEGFAEAQQLITTNQGKAIMDSVRLISSTIIRQTQKQTQEHLQQNIGFFEWEILIVIVCTFLVVSVIIGFAWITLRFRAQEQATTGAAEKVQSHLKQNMDAIVNTSLYSIVVLEAIRDEQNTIQDFRYVLLNAVAQKQFLMDVEEIQRSSLLQLFPGVKNTGQFEWYRKVVETGEDIRFDVFYQGDGYQNWFTNACSKLNDGLVVYYYDITGEKLAEETIRQLNQELAMQNAKLEQIVEERTSALHTANAHLRDTIHQLEEVNKELEAFSYSISHDLRAPLRTVNGFAEILLDKYAPALDDEAKRLIGKIRLGAQKMGVLIDELLALSRLGRKTLHLTEVDMNRLVESVLADVNPHNELQDFRLDIAPLPAITGDATLLAQVWQNLLSNAIKYSRHVKNKAISIKSFADSEKIVYIIHDMGAGFDMKYANKLFQVFQRLHKDSEFEGTGVGLAIVKRIVTKHNGDVWAESSPQEGTSFYFSIPRHIIALE